MKTGAKTAKISVDKAKRLGHTLFMENTTVINNANGSSSVKGASMSMKLIVPEDGTGFDAAVFTQDETFIHCLVCDEWEGHKDDCAVPIVKAWPQDPFCRRCRPCGQTLNLNGKW